MYKRAVIFTLCFLLTGCIGGFKFPKLVFGKGVDSASAEVNKAQTNNAEVNKVITAEEAVANAQKKFDAQEEQLRKDLETTYEKQLQLITDNNESVAELAYGISYISKVAQPVQGPLVIDYLRANEILARTGQPKDVVAVKKDVDAEKSLALAALYAKYNASTELAVQQKQVIDTLNDTIAEKNKAYDQVIKDNDAKITKLQTDKDTVVDTVKKDAKTSLSKALDDQKNALLSEIVKVFLGVAVLFLILAILLKSISFGTVSMAAFALSYFAAVIPAWIMIAIVCVLGLIVIIADHFHNIKNALTSLPRLTHSVVVAPAVVAPVPAATLSVPQSVVVPTVVTQSTLLTETKTLSSQ